MSSSDTDLLLWFSV